MSREKKIFILSLAFVSSNLEQKEIEFYFICSENLIDIKYCIVYLKDRFEVFFNNHLIL